MEAIYSSDRAQQNSSLSTTQANTSSSSVGSSYEQYSQYSDVDSPVQSVQDRVIDWKLYYPRLCAFHDCVSLASAWSLGPPITSLERTSSILQAQSPSDDDNGDGKSNELLLSCPSFRNELGGEPIRSIGLNRFACDYSEYAKELTSNETWLRENTAAEAGLLEDVSNVYLGGRLCAARQSRIVIEPQDVGSYYYRHCFVGRNHCNFFGTDENYGPIVVSVVKEVTESKESETEHQTNIYRLIVRIGDLRILRATISEGAICDSNEQRSIRSVTRDLVEILCPQIQFSCLRHAIPASSKIEELLTKIDEQPIYKRYKVGVMYCGESQSSEEEIYNNEHGSTLFEEFLDFLGQRVRLKGFDQYKGGLDIRGDTTGTHSIYAEYQSHEIMFHISTFLPFTPRNKQQLSRKRHIGNDMVTIVFQDPGALPFAASTVKSHFQHVFIVIRANSSASEDVTYTVAVARAKDVPSFGPPLQSGATFPKCKEFHDVLLTKVINAENAVHRSKKFATMIARTRREALKEIVENFTASYSNEGPSRIASRLLGSSVKRKERIRRKPQLDDCLRGALSWLVDVHDHSMNQRITCVLGVSAENIVLLDIPSGAVVFSTSTYSVIGWANTDMGLKIYYDHGQMLHLRCCSWDSSDAELNSLIRRLECVTRGVEAKEIVYHKAKNSESHGFHLQEEGVVIEVEMYQTAWRSGLRQGSRIVEVEGRPFITISCEEVYEQLEKSSPLRLVIISPALDGSPRRGCEDPNCPTLMDDYNRVSTPDIFTKQSTSLHNIMYRNKLKGEVFVPLRDECHGMESHTANNIKNSSLSTGPLKQAPEDHSSTSLIENMIVSTDTVDSFILEKFQDDINAESGQMSKSSFMEQNSDIYCSNYANNSKLSGIRLYLQKMLQEKKITEQTAEKLRIELAKERKAHDLTKRNLEELRKTLAISPVDSQQFV